MHISLFATEKKWLVLFCLIVCCLLLSFCHQSATNKIDNDSILQAKIKLGQYLFYDTRLSANNTKACATCHAPQLAFSDGYRRSSGIYADETLHNSPSLLHVGDRKTLNWANPSLTSLEEQMRRPLFSVNPVEMGAKNNEIIIYERLKKDSLYQRMFAECYPFYNNFINFDNIIECIAHFLHTLKSRHSPYDIYLATGDTTHFNHLARKGQQLFFSDRLGCGNCHHGIDLDTPIGEHFANIGLYYCYGGYPVHDSGVAEITKQAADNGKFRIPSLRNVALTAPYFHDGTAATLYEVLSVYENNGRNITYGNCVGDARDNPQKDNRLRHFSITYSEKQQIIAFLYSLTDTSYLQNAHFISPFVSMSSVK